MIKYTSTPIKVLGFFLLISIFFSCSKDSDLLSDYVLADSLDPIEDIETREEIPISVDLENGTIQTNEDNIAVFNISDIANTASSKSTILKNIVQPINGEIIIEKDSIIKYMPENDFNGTDVFSYTLEVVNEDNTTSQEEASIEIEVVPVKDVVNDAVAITTETEMIIQALANDTFADKERVVITETSTPNKGSVLINSDQTLTYMPNPNEAGQDSFTYTTEIDHSDGSVSSEVGSIEVAINTTSTGQDATISADVANWKELFDALTLDDNRQIALSNSADGGDIYYIDVSAYVYMFQVTGQDSYMDFAITIFENLMATASTRSDGYQGWIDGTNDITNGVGQNDGLEYSLTEGRGFRTIARMLWVLSNSPTYLAKGTNQTKYNTALSFFQTNVWNKWESRGAGHFYRSRTHMSSHWVQIAWFLHEITQTQKYRDVYENWSYAGFPSGDYVGGNMRDQLRETALTGGNGYLWASGWGTQTGTNDVSHANAEVELMVLGAEMSDYWTTTDMEKIIRSFDQLIIKGNDWETQAYRIDGSGTGPAFFDQGWIQLGRFSEALQSKLENAELLPTYYYQQKARIANLAYNRAYLENNLFYPEQ